MRIRQERKHATNTYIFLRDIRIVKDLRTVKNEQRICIRAPLYVIYVLDYSVSTMDIIHNIIIDT